MNCGYWRLALALGLCIGSVTGAAATGRSETLPYLGTSFTLTPSGDSSTGSAALYTTITAGLVWKKSQLWTYRFSYDFGVDTVGSGVTTYSTLTAASTYKLSEVVQPKLSAQNTVTNNFDFYALRLKPSLRIVAAEDLKVDPGGIIYVDTTNATSLGASMDLDYQATEEWSLQAAAEVTERLDTGASPKTQYSFSGGATYEATDELSLYFSVIYALGVTTSPAIGGSGKNAGNFVGPRAKPAKVSTFAGTTTPKTSLMIGALYCF